VVITGGGGVAQGGGIYNEGRVLIYYSSIEGNAATNEGGGVYNESATSIAVISRTSDVKNNTADIGAGIYNNGGALTVESGSTVASNTAVSSGGGIAGGGTILIDEGHVSDNDAGLGGGGIWNSGMLTLQNNTTIVGNQAFTGAGISNDGTLLVDHSTFLANSAGLGAGTGGAIHNIGTATIQHDSQIGGHDMENFAGYGAGISNAGTLTIDDSIVEYNFASANGGGFWNTGTLTIQNGSIVRWNNAANGGGIFNDLTLTIDGSDFTGNTVSGNGGGLYNNQGSATIQNGTDFTGNDADNGGAIYNDATITLNDGAFTGNSASVSEGGAIFNNDTLTAAASAFMSNSATQGSAVFNAPNVVNASAVTGSCIAGNNNTAVYNNSAASQNFTGNWWGAADGPSGAGPGSGDAVGAMVDFNGYLNSESGLCVHNLLLNASFETDANADSRPDDWTAKNLVISPTADGQDCTEATDGTCSMRFVGDGNSSKLQQDILVSGSSDDDLTLTFDTMTDSVGGGGANRVKVIVYYNNGTKSTYKVSLPTGTNGWTPITVPVLANANYFKIRVMIQFTKTAGTAWFDHFVLTVD
jgi:hypothetical protein